MDERLEERWSQLVEPDPAVDATVRPPRQVLEAARTLAAPAEPPPRLGVSLQPRARAQPAGADLEILGTIGTGGMGQVLLARQRSLDRDVAVKAALPEDPRSAAAILHEGVVTGSLEHPAIVPVHLIGVDDANRPAFVMKRIVGVTWLELIQNPGHEAWKGWAGDFGDRLPGHVQIMTAICNALHFAHSRGFVHRDIKPANVLIGRFGDVYLADWGLAAPIGESGGDPCGTPGFLAPEMALGERIDERTDVYLLAACLHQVLTGSPRHAAPTALAAVARSIASEDHVFADDVPFELAELVNRGCARDPGDRPASALAFRDALDAFVRHRESVGLATEARELVEQLEARAGADSEEARAAFDRLNAQAGYALERALRAWPDNPVATETRARHEALLADRRAREAKLQSDARERDPSLWSGSRAAGLTSTAVIIVAMTAYSAWPDRPWQSPAVEGVLYPAVVWLLAVFGAFLTRRSVMRTRFNRAATGTLLAILTFIPIERLVGTLAEIPAWAHFAFDMFFVSGATAIYGITQRPWALWVAGLALISGAGCVLMPDWSLFFFGVLGPLTVALAAVFAWRDRRSNEAS